MMIMIVRRASKVATSASPPDAVCTQATRTSRAGARLRTGNTRISIGAGPSQGLGQLSSKRHKIPCTETRERASGGRGWEDTKTHADHGRRHYGPLGSQTPTLCPASRAPFIAREEKPTCRSKWHSEGGRTDRMRSMDTLEAGQRVRSTRTREKGNRNVAGGECVARADAGIGWGQQGEAHAPLRIKISEAARTS